MTADDLLALIASAPVEAGMLHPAERGLEQFLASHGARPLFETLTPDLVRLLGRNSVVDLESRRFVVRHALESASVEMRDAGVHAAEAWADVRLVPILLSHREPVACLAEYIRRVFGEGRP